MYLLTLSFLNILLFMFSAGQGLKKLILVPLLKLDKNVHDSELTSYQNTSFIISL